MSSCNSQQLVFTVNMIHNHSKLIIFITHIETNFNIDFPLHTDPEAILTKAQWENIIASALNNYIGAIQHLSCPESMAEIQKILLSELLKVTLAWL